MLTPEQWKGIGKQAETLYNQLELEIIEEMAERIANVGYANTVVINDAKIAQEMGILYEDVIKLVAEYNNTTEVKVKEIFEEAGIKSIGYDDKIYKLAGLETIPLKQSESMWQLLETTALKTSKNLSNLVMTIAETSQTTFYNAMNKAYMEVSTGVKSYTQSIMDTIKEVGKQGTSIKYPSGRKLSLESAVRMNIVTGINQTCGKLQLMRADELEWDLMELTAHVGARPTHAEWQGKIVSRSGKEGYLSLSDIGYGEATGFKGVNCRHDWRPYYEGSTRTYSNKELKEMANETVTYNGKEFSYYEATQVQREMERQIRQDKKDIAGLQGILTSNTKDNKLIEKTKTEFARKSLIYNAHKNELDNFIQQTSFRKDNARLLVYDKYNSSQISKVTKLANKYNNSDIVGTIVNGTKITEIGEHIISRTYARGLKFEDVEDTLKNPLKYGNIKTDEQGRRSFAIIGKKITIYVNPDTGKMTTTHATSSKLVKKLEEQKDEDKK